MYTNSAEHATLTAVIPRNYAQALRPAQSSKIEA